MKKKVLKKNFGFGTLVLNLHDIGCKNRCIFCGEYSSYAGKEEADAIAGQELEKLKLLGDKNLNIGQIIISGNDPLEYYDLVGFLRKIKKRTPMSVFLQSHCISFENINYLKEVVSVGNISKIQIPIYGHNAKIHDSVTGNSGSFKSVMRAIGNFKKIGFDKIQINTLFLKQNENYLYPFFSFLINFGYVIDASLPCIPSFKGVYSHRSKKYIPNVNKVKILFRKFKEGKKDISLLYLHDVPFCLAPGATNVSFKSVSYRGYDHFRNKPIDIKITDGEIVAAYRVLSKEKKCRSCALDSICKGITKPYIDLGLFKAKPLASRNTAVSR
jgi:MoaA/NifB/PqqE/SkfB family radical SAM enzyme